jgi:gliding motility-associated-like protein
LSYHPTLADAELDTNEITTPTAYTNTTRDEQVIYVRDENTVTGCWNTTPLTLKVLALPEPGNLPTYTECSLKNDSTYPFDMSQHDAEILKGIINPQDYKVTYYQSQATATAGGIGTQLNTPYINKSNPETVWARIEHKKEKCFVVGSFNIAVSEGVTVTRPRTTLTSCGTETQGDKEAVFNLRDKEPEILTGLTASDYTVKYYERSLNNKGVDEILTPEAYTNTKSPQTIYAEVERNSNGCRSLTSFEIEVLVKPIVELEPERIICVDPKTKQTMPGAEFTLKVNLLDATHTFEWSKDGDVLVDQTTNEYEVAAPGVYTVVATNKGTSCSSDPEVVNVVASSYPVVDYAKTITPAFSGSHTIEIKVIGSGKYLYQISNATYKSELQESNIFENVKPGLYDYIVQDANGCLEDTKGQVFATDYMKFFTPNGDGVNEEWNIIGLSDNAQAKIYIFDRYGKLITEISPQGKGWDGTLNGYPLPANDYWFTVEFTDNGELKEYKSHFTLKR